jgi:hypothetical protein
VFAPRAALLGLLLAVAGALGCGVQPVDIVAKQCPCPEPGYHCNKLKNQCEPGDAPPSVPPEQLATGQNFPQHIAVGNGAVIFSTGHFTAESIARRCALPDCAGGPTDFAPGLGTIQDIVVAGDLVFLSSYDSSGMFVCSQTECPAQPDRRTSTPDPEGMALRGINLYFAGGNFDAPPERVIGQMLVTSTSSSLSWLSGSEKGPLNKDLRVSVAANDSYVMWLTATRLLRCEVGGCADPTEIATHNGAVGLAANDAHVYWARYEPNGSILRCDPSDCAGTEMVIASGQPQPAFVRVDQAYVYWTNEGDGTVHRCDLSGCGPNGPELLADGQDSAWGLALDDEYLYWTTKRADGTVMRKKK